MPVFEHFAEDFAEDIVEDFDIDGFGFEGFADIDLEVEHKPPN